MRGRRVGATTQFKRHLRALRRGKKVATPKHLASGTPVVLSDRQGGWDVWSPPIAGPPFVPARKLAGGFDTRDEAQAWIAENELTPPST